MVNKNINIKVNRLIAIQELESKLVAAKAAQEAYEKEMRAYNEAVTLFHMAVKNELIAGNFDWSTDTYGDLILTDGSLFRAHIKLTNMPAVPQKNQSYRSQNFASVKDIERMIRLLKMSTDESVSTKVYDSLGEML